MMIVQKRDLKTRRQIKIELKKGKKSKVERYVIKSGKISSQPVSQPGRQPASREHINGYLCITPIA